MTTPAKVAVPALRPLGEPENTMLPTQTAGAVPVPEAVPSPSCGAPQIGTTDGAPAFDVVTVVAAATVIAADMVTEVTRNDAFTVTAEMNVPAVMPVPLKSIPGQSLPLKLPGVVSVRVVLEPDVPAEKDPAVEYPPWSQ